MPKEITHWMVAERALAALPSGSSLKNILKQHRTAYLAGAVLPDSLLHIFRGPFHPTALNLGHAFHDQQGNSYAPLIRAEKAYADGFPHPLFSVFLGVISHMEADATLHPYVYAATGNGGIGEHYRLETGIDVHVLRRGFVPMQRRLEGLFSPATREALVTAAGHLFDPDKTLPRQALERSLELHCRFQRMYDRLFWKLAVRVLGRVVGSPFREQRHLFYPLHGAEVMPIAVSESGEWRHPETGEVRRETVDELVQKAVERTGAVFMRIEDMGSLTAALAEPPGRNLLTGLHGVCKGD